MLLLRLSGFTMNVIAVSDHAMSLLSRLNSQRAEGQFCDCVIRPSSQPSPHRLYLAHRNVLAASSPVLASLLSPTGALLDLRGPCLTGEVLGYLLDYIYTGSLPPPPKQHSLLSAATYLQMEELQRCLRSSLDAEHQSDWTADVSRDPHPMRRSVYDQRPCGKCDDSPPSRGAVPVICHSRTAARPSPPAETAPSQGLLSSRADGTDQGSETNCRLHHSGSQREMEDDFYQPSFKDRKLESASTGEVARDEPGCRGGQRAWSRWSPAERAALTQPVVCSDPRSGRVLSARFRKAGRKADQAHSSSHIHLSANDCSCPPSDHASTERAALDFDDNVLPKCDQSESETEATPRVRPSFLFENISDADDVIADSSQDRLGSKFAGGPSDERERAESGRRAPGKHPCGAVDRSLPGEVTSQESGNTHSYQGQVRYYCLPREAQQHGPAPTCLLEEKAPSRSPAPNLSHGRRPNPLCDSPGMSANQSTVSSLFLVDVAAMPLPAGSWGALGGSVPGGGGGGGCGQPYQCSQCERVFSQRGSLNRHLRSHLGVRPYPCPRCPMTFSRQYRVTEHLRVHRRVPPENVQRISTAT